MRETTVKRMAILIASLGLVGGTGFLTHRVQLRSMAQLVLKQADRAEQESDFAAAERLYQEHLEVIPGDLDVQLKYADVLLKVAKTPKRKAEAFEIYSNIVKRAPGRGDARRRLVELEIEEQQFKEARTDLSILLKTAPDDGFLQFLMGECCEKEGDESTALAHYQRAIECNAPQRLEAYQRRASLLRELGQTKEAEEAIEKMVQSDPKNDQVYLERGHYRRRFHLEGAGGDFQKAMELAPGKPEVYLEMAETAEKEAGGGKSSRAVARQHLENGLKAAPTSVALYDALAGLELRDGRTERALEVLELGLKSVSDQLRLRWFLAIVLAQRGDTGRLLLQIRELAQIGCPPVLLQYLRAHYEVNAHEYVRARQLLVPLLAEVGQHPDLKVRINLLLARCYGQLGEPEMAQTAELRALGANPDDVTAQLGYIDNLVRQGDLDGAIQRYEELVDRVPQIRSTLVRLLIERNRRLPVPKRDWSNAGRLIEDIAKDEPGSVTPVILRAELLLAQGQAAKADDELAKGRLRFPKSVELWNAQASVIGAAGRIDEALRLLEEAQQQLGDRVELRLQRARLWASKKGPQVIIVLNSLAQKSEAFSKEDRHKLLNGLAAELVRQEDLQGASRLWSQLADEEPSNIELRRTLLDLAFQTANPTDKDRIEKYIKEIEQIGGSEGLLARYCQVRYLIWQTRLVKDKKVQEALRTRARVLLSELKSRYEDWSVIPLALAELEEQELAQGGLDDMQKREKQESIVNSYMRAIDRGQHEPAVVRRAVELLFAIGRGSEALPLLSRIPVALQFAGDVGRTMTQTAVAQGDYRTAEEIARKAVAANPDNFQERLWLIRILLTEQQFGRAEDELRQAVNLDKSDPDRWTALVQVMILTKQPEKAAKAVQDAEANLPQPKVPLTLAQCCELMGQVYAGGSRRDEMEKWYGKAQRWYEKAEAAQPHDFLVTRLFTRFFLRTGRIKEAESKLEAILKGGTGAKNVNTVIWAKRTLALTLAFGGDSQGAQRALTLLEPADRSDAMGHLGKALEDPEDLRVLALVLGAQKTPVHRKRAVGILESLVAKNLANPEDRFLLARLLEDSGEWSKAQKQYREVILQSENPRDVETVGRRPLYLTQFANSLIRHGQTGNGRELPEAEEQVEKLKRLQPNLLSTVALEVELKRAQSQIGEAVSLIQGYADRPNRATWEYGALAELAEKLGQFQLAEQLYRRFADASDVLQGKLALVAFLGRRDRVKDALDFCEPLWRDIRDSRTVSAVATRCMEVLLGSKSPVDKAQLERVAGWMDQALARGSHSTILVIGLGTIRERQERYQEAEDLYQRAIKQGDREGVLYNNLAWLMALKDGNGSGALRHVNVAIALEGPGGVHLADFLDTRAVAYLVAGQSQRAIKDLNDALAAAPSAAKYFHLAQAYLADNNKEKARQSLEAAKIKGLGPSDLHPLEQVAYRKLLRELEM